VRDVGAFLLLMLAAMVCELHPWLAVLLTFAALALVWLPERETL